MRMYNKEKQAFIYIALEIILIIPYLCAAQYACCCLLPSHPWCSSEAFPLFSPLLLPLTSTAHHPLSSIRPFKSHHHRKELKEKKNPCTIKWSSTDWRSPSKGNWVKILQVSQTRVDRYWPAVIFCNFLAPSCVLQSLWAPSTLAHYVLTQQLVNQAHRYAHTVSCMEPAEKYRDPSWI